MGYYTHEVLVIGRVVARCSSAAEAVAEARRLNREAAEELGEELLGDGAASVYDLARGEWVRVD